ncbi:MAG: calcium/sodium antiporter [Planctomycetota bacterium]|nr:calcium/sodium antiporter [Planctomycetota bacterium]
MVLASLPVTTTIELLVGFLLLWKGGDLLVEGADRFARSYGVPSTLAGVFILGFGTSVPELATSVLAILDDKPGIAIGNVVGSNIANVALILGVTACLAAVPVNRFLQRVEIPFGIVVSVLAIGLAWDGEVSGMDGPILLIAFAGYAVFAITTARHRDQPDDDRPDKRAWFDLGMATLALAAVVGGARLFVSGASTVAAWLEVSDGVIGVTLVALGTSLPELATGIAAARAHKLDLALGNIIGSNIFNLLMVLGVASTLRSQPLDPQMIDVDMMFMLGLAIAPWVFGAFFRRIPRWGGVLFLATYVSYIVVFSGVI